MLFHSWLFWTFFGLVYLVYLLLGRRGQNVLLLAASYAFYAAWDWRFLGLMLASTAIDFAAGHAIAATDRRARRRAWLTLSVVFNLGVLGFFKYFDFFAESTRDLLMRVGFEADPVLLNVILPVGISFYTFQTMSYTIDVFRGQTPPARSPLDFALYVAFFPQLVAGPIERSHRLLPQIQQPRRLTHDHLRRGAWLVVYGLFLKIAVADNLAVFADGLFGEPQPSGLGVWTRVLAFTFQIYADFAGYSAIARGVAAFMGFDLMVNFRAPYFSANPSEFWRRWHISLSTWLRDYLYIPLGGNRGGGGATARNLGLTMLLGGLWHGAGWNFVLWGAYHGALLALYRVISPRRPAERRADPPPATPNRVRRLLTRTAAIALFFVLTMYGWLLFRAQSLDDVVSLTRAGIQFAGSFTTDNLLLLATIGVVIAPVVALDIATYRSKLDDPIAATPPAARWPLIAFLAAWTFILGARASSEFIYFQF